MRRSGKWHYPFDARGIARRFRHSAIFGAPDPGETMRSMNDHDPLPLLNQIEMRYGDGVAIGYRQREPGEIVIDFVRQQSGVRFVKKAPLAIRPAAPCFFLSPPCPHQEGGASGRRGGRCCLGPCPDARPAGGDLSSIALWPEDGSAPPVQTVPKVTGGPGKCFRV